MPGGRSYSSLTKRTTTTVDPGSGGTTLIVADSTVFSSLDGRFPYTVLVNWGQADQELMTVTARPSGTTLTVIRGIAGTTAQAHAIGATVDHGVYDADFLPDIVPTRWTIFGHSYTNWVNGVTFQTGRTDALFRGALNVPWSNWANFGVSGALLCKEGRSTGGWARVMQEVTRPMHGAPYYPDGGGTALIIGLNDTGALAGSTQAQIRATYQLVLTAVISRMRSSVVFENDFSVGTRTTYGAGFTSQTGTSDYSSGSSVHKATSTTNATVTMTLPSDYAGEPVAVQWIAQAGATNGTVTYSGTAGVTGSLTLTNAVQSGAGTHVPVVSRFTNLTAANAGQTIVATVSSVDSGGAVLFDCWSLEAKQPPPVIVANVARVVNYSGYANGIGDADVTALNNTIAASVASFGDGMVQVADIDSAINKTALWFAGDGFHPNELGAAAAAGAMRDAVRRLTPSVTATPALNMTVSTPIAGAVRRPRQSGLWYSAEGPTTTTITPTAQDLYAAPFIVTESREQYTRIATRVAVGGTVAGTIRWGIYDDPKWVGYPQCLVSEATGASGALSLGTTAGMVQNPASGNGSIFWCLDPGLYWLCVKIITAGTGQTLECVVGPDTHGILPLLNPGDLSNLTTPMGWVIGGQGTGALPTVWPSGGFVVARFPKMGLLVA